MSRAATVRRDPGEPRGTLQPAPPRGQLLHRRIGPTAALAPWIAHFWSVQWQLDAPYLARTLPHPCVHLVFEGGARRRATVTGVCTRRFTRRLHGRGWVFGVKFRPGAFVGLHPAATATWTDRVATLSSVLGPDGRALAQAIAASDDVDARVAAAEAWLLPRLRPLPTAAIALRDLVESLERARGRARVETLARRLGLDARTLQRRFHRFVGVGPKWVLQRYRLHEAAARLQSPTPPTLVALAAELGYADQAHFARDFAAMVGEPPGRYLRRARAQR
ncbi:MAG: helix-turn-helix domain-containing protein [Nannocystaceae bacterium]|nr:helix-turn-helix domain-containing protein [Nannocystaceae bacterium]